MLGSVHYSSKDREGRAKKRHISVSYFPIRPHVTQVGSEPKGSDIEVMRSLAAIMDFTADFSLASSFEDLVRTVAEGKADMCISHAAIALHRYQLGLDFSTLVTQRYVFVQRHPVAINSMYTTVHPFTLAVWLAILATTVCIGIFIALLQR